MTKKQYTGWNVSVGTVKKSKAAITPAPYPAQIPSHGSFRDLETERLQFAVDLRCAPADILLCHPADEITNLSGDPRPATPRSGSPEPVETEAGAVPADDGLGLDDDQNVGPPAPKAVEGCREEPVEGVQFGPRSLPFEHGDLLREGEDFEGRVTATAEEDTDHGEDECRTNMRSTAHHFPLLLCSESLPHRSGESP